MNRCLGRKAVKLDSRTLKLSAYFTERLAPAPVSRDWSKGITAWGMLDNDTLGDCTCAGVGHAVMVWTANLGDEAVISDADVLDIYQDWCGYNPNDPSTDQGGIELDVLNDWKTSSFAGHRLDAYAAALTSNTDEIKQAINLFGGLYIGLSVPNSVMANTDPSITWDVVPDDGGIDGGHCVYVVGYDADTVTFISWGALYKMTWAFWNKYVDEAYALLSQDFLAANGLDPDGFNLAQLQADLAEIH